MFCLKQKRKLSQRHICDPAWTLGNKLEQRYDTQKQKQIRKHQRKGRWQTRHSQKAAFVTMRNCTSKGAIVHHFTSLYVTRRHKT